jgi:VanZ family protein
VSRFPRTLILWFLLVVVWLTLAPFELRPSSESELHLLSPIDRETVAHLTLLVPLAAALASGVPRRSGRRAWLRSAGAIVLLAVLLEVGQLWIAYRGASIYDALAGILGGLVTLAAVGLLREAGVPTSTWIGGSLAAVLSGVLVLFVGGVLTFEIGQSLAHWSGDFRLAAGNEPGGGREYRGSVEQPQVCAGEPPGELCLAPGAGPAERRALARLAEATQRIRLSAVVLSDAAEQFGPARIVTFSEGPYFRNVTLAQSRRDLVLRLRTRRAGSNGMDFRFRLPDAILPGVPTRVRASFDGGTVRMRALASSSDLPRGERIRRGTFDPPLRFSLLVRGLSYRLPFCLLGRALAFGTFLAFAGIGLGAGWVGAARYRSVAVVFLGCLAFWPVAGAALHLTPRPSPALWLLSAASAAAGCALVTAERLWVAGKDLA